MSFKNQSGAGQSIALLQRSLQRGRLAHAYLFSGNELQPLESVALALAKTLNCLQPVIQDSQAIDCCDRCLSCQKIEHGNHSDVHWVRPESKSRIITVDQMRDLMREIQLKPKESRLKVAILVAADRLRVEGANAFLKTLEEPPEDSVLVLLTTEPQRVLETIVSRCLRLSFGYGLPGRLDPSHQEWIRAFSESANNQQKSLMSRYLLLDVLLRKLSSMKATIEESLTARSPLQKYEDVDKSLVERWEDELAASVEAEYRRQRSDLLGILHWWLRDVWVQTLEKTGANRSTQSNKSAASPIPGPTPSQSLLTFPELPSTRRVAERISPAQALGNLQVLDELQRWLRGNVQEALALEVGLLKLHL